MPIIPGERPALPNTPTPIEVASALRCLDAQTVAPGVWTARLSTGQTVLITDPGSVDVFAAAVAVADWLDENNGADTAELASRILKVGEEYGAAIKAWTGATGQNPREGETHTYADVCSELGRVVLAALVAIDSLTGDPVAVLARTAARALARIGGAR